MARKSKNPIAPSDDEMPVSAFKRRTSRPVEDEPEPKDQIKRKPGRPAKAKTPFQVVAENLKHDKAPVPKQFKDPSLRAQILKLLKDELRVSVEEGGFTNPNDRIVVVKFGDHIVCKDTFNVKQTREYEG